MDHSALLPTGTPHPTHHLARIILWLLGIACGGYIILTLGYSIGRWNGPIALRIARVIPTPLGWYHGAPIWQRDVVTMSSGMRVFASSAEAANAGLAAPSGNPEAIGYTTYIRTLATRSYLADHGITVREADIAQSFTAQISQSGSENTLADHIQQLYGWTPLQYRTYVTTADVLRAKLRAAVIADERISSSQRQQAKQILAMVNEKKLSFSDIAKKYSEDYYAPAGGDLGFVGRGELTQELEDVAFRLQVGQHSDVIVSPYGFHILQVTEQRQKDGDLQVHLLQIFIAGPDIDQIITAELRQHPPILWEVGLRWDRDQARVVER